MKKFNIISPTQEDIRENSETGFIGAWHIAEDYEIRDDHIIQMGENLTSYYPYLRKELPNAISKLKDDKSILKFVQKYGRFGFKGYFEESEPLSWIKAHIKGINLALELIEIIQDSDEERAREVKNSLLKEASHMEIDGQIEPVVLIGENSEIVPRMINIFTKENSLVWACEMFNTIISSNVRNVSRLPMTTENLKIQSKLAFHSLYQVVYWQILDAAELGQFKLCEHCQKPFISTDKRQKYCPPEFRQRESNCAYNARQQRRKKRLNKTKDMY